jgi:hypothetical protein
MNFDSTLVRGSLRYGLAARDKRARMDDVGGVAAGRVAIEERERVRANERRQANTRADRLRSELEGDHARPFHGLLVTGE